MVRPTPHLAFASLCALAALSTPIGAFAAPTTRQLFPNRWCAPNAYPSANPLDVVSTGGSSSRSWGPGGVRYFTLVEPVVNQAVTNLANVKKVGDRANIPPNSRIWVGACGCVQTGGKGLTWKRYVDPSGPNSPRLYHGAIQVPGARALGLRISPTLGGEFVRLGDLIAWQSDPTHVWATTRSTSLTLGYEDDQYDDNSYERPDDGTEQQCKNIGNAAITIYVEYYKP